MCSHQPVVYLEDYAKLTTPSESCSLDTRGGETQGSLRPRRGGGRGAYLFGYMGAAERLKS